MIIKQTRHKGAYHKVIRLEGLMDGRRLMNVVKVGIYSGKTERTDKLLMNNDPSGFLN